MIIRLFSAALRGIDAHEVECSCSRTLEKPNQPETGRTSPKIKGLGAQNRPRPAKWAFWKNRGRNPAFAVDFGNEEGSSLGAGPAGRSVGEELVVQPRNKFTKPSSCCLLDFGERGVWTEVKLCGAFHLCPSDPFSDDQRDLHGVTVAGLQGSCKGRAGQPHGEPIRGNPPRGPERWRTPTRRSTSSVSRANRRPKRQD